MTSSQDTWALVRAAYCGSTESIAKICARLEVKERELYRRLDSEGWGRRSSKPGFVDPFKRGKRAAPSPAAAAPPDVPPEVPAAAKPRGRHTRGSVPAKRRKRLTPAQKLTKAALALRLYNALDLKLTQLEDLMERGDEKTTIDQGRQTRAISQLIKAFERVTEYDPDLLKSASLAGLVPGTAAASTPAADAAAGNCDGTAAVAASDPAAPGTEQRRREIAERLERIIAKRIAASGSGGA